MRLRPRRASLRQDVIKELSSLLITYARLRGAVGDTTLRNPGGVARKVDKFRAAEAGKTPASVGGAGMEAEIWAAYKHDRVALIRNAEITRLKIYEGAATALEPEAPTPSRGPTPSFGSVVHTREDGECVVYRFELCGPVEIILPHLALDGMRVLKIGRSNDVARRMKELNTGFPPSSTLRWKLLSVTVFESGAAAHRAEQAELLELKTNGLTIGGEFAVAPFAYPFEVR